MDPVKITLPLVVVASILMLASVDLEGAFAEPCTSPIASQAIIARLELDSFEFDADRTVVLEDRNGLTSCVTMSGTLGLLGIPIMYQVDSNSNSARVITEDDPAFLDFARMLSQASR